MIPFLIGYGYWKSLSYGYAHINLLFETKDKTKDYTLSNAKIAFYNSDNKILAEGTTAIDYGTISLIHPTAGDCNKIVRPGSLSSESRQAWDNCYQQHGHWIPKWIKNVSSIKVQHKRCTTQLIPVIVNQYNSAWQLWWIPLPHVGGEPQSYFSIYIDISESDCIEI